MRNRIITLIQEAAHKDPAILFLTGDLGFSVVEPLQESMGQRFINMGIAEANMISVGSSLVASGFKVFAYSIAPFITARCFEQIRNDACYQRRPLKLIGVGGGYSYGSLGPSHHALEDAHILGALPNLVIGNPANVGELNRFFAITLDADETVYFRIPRESGAPWPVPDFTLATGAYVLRDGGDLTIITSGVSLLEALKAADLLALRGVSARIISVPVLKPFPQGHLTSLLVQAPVLTLFEGYGNNPLATGVMKTLLDAGLNVPYADLHVANFAHEVGNTEFLRYNAKINSEAILEKIIIAFGVTHGCAISISD